MVVAAAPEDLERVTSFLREQGVRVLESHGPSRRVRVEGSASVLSGLFGSVLNRTRRPDGGIQARLRSGLAGPQARASSFTPVQLAQVYGMPEADGSGQTVAIIELGGGFAQDDLDTYFSGLGLTVPTVTAVGVDGARNVPGQDPGGADGEVLLGIDVVGAVAPGADVVVYFAPNSDAGSGVHVDFPALSPHALGCGGTRLSVSDGAVTETVWNDAGAGGATGGGVSDVFAVPLLAGVGGGAPTVRDPAERPWRARRRR